MRVVITWSMVALFVCSTSLPTCASRRKRNRSSSQPIGRAKQPGEPTWIGGATLALACSSTGASTRFGRHAQRQKSPRQRRMDSLPRSKSQSLSTKSTPKNSTRGSTIRKPGFDWRRCRHEVPRHYGETLRRTCFVGLRSLRLERRRRHALRQRHSPPSRSRLPQARPPLRFVLLSSPGLDSPRRRENQEPKKVAAGTMPTKETSTSISMTLPFPRSRSSSPTTTSTSSGSTRRTG